MTIYNICPSCGNRVDIAGSYNAPQELVQEKGETMSMTCDGCKTTFMGENNRTRARPNPLKIGLGIGGSVVLGAVIWNLGYIAAIAAAPAYIMYKIESGGADTYNSQSRRKYG